MKKILSIVAIGALFTSYGFADNTITTTGIIKPSAIVKLGSSAAGTLTTNSSYLVDKLDVTIGDTTNGLMLGSDNTTELDVYVNTNSSSTVGMKIDSSNTADGKLTNGANTINTVYSYKKVTGNYSDFAIGGSEIELSDNGIKDGVNKVGTFKITATPTATQIAGTYTSTLTVAVVAH